VREADEITLADLLDSLQWRVTSVGDPEPVHLA
jgi:hypothetical protein